MQYTKLFWNLLTSRMIYRSFVRCCEREGDGVVIDAEKTVKAIDNAIQFMKGQNVPFDAEVLKQFFEELFYHNVVRVKVKKGDKLEEKIAFVSSVSEALKRELSNELALLCEERDATPLPQPMPKITARQFLKPHLDLLLPIIEQGAPVKRTLLEFARKQGFDFDETTLLRAWNALKRCKRRCK